VPLPLGHAGPGYAVGGHDEDTSTNAQMNLPEGYARIVSYHDGPAWEKHSTFALQPVHGRALAPPQWGADRQAC
jgi:hypothetical protein